MPALQSIPETSSLSLTQTRFIRASRARVYEAWTNPEIMRQWFGSPTMQCASAQLDVRVGGDYSIKMALRPGADPAATGGHTTSEVHGHYVRVVPGELLQFTWIPAWNPAEESLVTVTLKDAPGGIELIALHERFLSEASRDGHNAGWTSGLDRMQQLLAN